MKQNVRTNERFAIVLFLLLLLMVVYQNCGVPVRVQPAMVHKLSQENVSALQDLDEHQKKMLCETSAFYSCNHEIYSPGAVPSSPTYYSRCLDISGAELSFCVNVSLSTYNTRELVQNCETCTEKDSEFGGKFNYEEVTCTNQIVGANQGLPVTVKAVAVDAAITKVVEICRETLKY
jgi:hypothetical protein